MKRATIRFSLELCVSYPDYLDDDWVSNQYLSSDRFSTLPFNGEPGGVIAASSSVEELIRHGE
jgi:hypothetical protein